VNQPVQRVSRYEVVSELGRGAMGVVYKAKDPNIERIIALKTMRIDVQGTDQEEILRRFKHEAKLAGVMAHPNIVAIYDAGEFEGVFYMALEFIEGETLQEILHREKTLSLERTIQIAKHVCQGLDYAHMRGVIHRDIKPANIMVGKDGVVKIMDFGIAKAGGNMTSAGQVLGTPTYMSPEQVRGRNLDGRSDLFSFGCCLYEMLTARKPYDGPNVTSIIYKIINDSPEPLHKVDPNISPKLSDVVSRCLEKDPELRYQSGADLIEDLEACKAKPGAPKPAAAVDRTAPIGPTGRPAVVPSAAAPAAAVVPGLKKPTPVPVTAAAAAANVHPSTVHVTQKAGRASPAHPRMQWWIGGIVLVLVFAAGAVFLRRSNEQAIADAASPSAGSNTIRANPVPMDSAKSAKTKSTKTKAASTPFPEATTASGDLRVTSAPSGVRVFISGMTQNDWVTPFTAAGLDPGVYEVQFSKSGYTSKTQDVTVEAGKTASIDVSLLESGGSISINSAPSGAGVWLDGKSTGKTTPATLSVDQGSHRIELRKQGFENEAATINVKDGETANYAPTLDPIPVATDLPKKGGGFFGKIFGGQKVPEGKGVSIVKSNPPGAQILVNGKAHNETAPARIALDPGKYKLTLKLAGRKNVVREVVIEKGKITESYVEFESMR
jgi:eukaryotic-like serine/threonine-protein kinase